MPVFRLSGPAVISFEYTEISSLNLRRLPLVAYSREETSEQNSRLCRPMTSQPENRVVVLIG